MWVFWRGHFGSRDGVVKNISSHSFHLSAAASLQDKQLRSRPGQQSRAPSARGSHVLDFVVFQSTLTWFC